MAALISYAVLRYKWGIQNACSPSRFIKEIDSKYLDLPSDFFPVLPGEGQEEKEKFVPEAYRKVMGQKNRPGSVNMGGRKLTSVNQATSTPSRPPAGFTPTASASAGQPPKDFTPSDPSLVRVGVKVEHPRFGIGSVIALEGADTNVKATVEFPIGKKQLLLKFAKLRVVE